MVTTATLKKLDNRVSTFITDPSRAARAAAILSSAQKDAKKFEKAYAESGKNLRRYYRDHKQNGARMMAEISSLEKRWETAQAKVLALRFELKSNLTKEEWERIFPRQRPSDP